MDPPISAEEKPVMLVGIDESEHSYYALEWTLDHFFSGPVRLFRLVITHCRPPASSVVGMGGPGAVGVLPFVDGDLRKAATRVLGKAKDLCLAKSVGDVLLEVVEGDARALLCDSVDRHHADMLVVGSHGYGTLKRAFLGSVSDYCSHHAHCSVMIVKRPKNKHH